MTKGETKMLETEAIIFPKPVNQNDTGNNSFKREIENTLVEQKSMKTTGKDRFARLKKSLRKRAASIL